MKAGLRAHGSQISPLQRLPDLAQTAHTAATLRGNARFCEGCSAACSASAWVTKLALGRLDWPDGPVPMLCSPPRLDRLRR